MSNLFIAVEGPIGVGKTSLTKAIASAFQFKQLHEIVDENPFLNKFYDNIEEWSFQTEMFFLCNRYKQLSDVKKQWIDQQQSVVADYHICKNLIFAKRTLAQEEYEKYEDIYSILTRDMPAPNVIIYLHASISTLMNRVEKRGRAFEQNMDEQYLQQLADDYELFMNQFEKEHPDIPIIRLNGDEYDFVGQTDDLQKIIQSIEHVLTKGVKTT